ncbi:MAG: hypothetical protein RL021_2059 [Bacteroidota bacterium]|jgi:hypothetical protein
MTIRLIRLTLLTVTLITASSLRAQELNCTVSVLSPNATESDRTIYQTLQTSLREFINNRKWTNDQFLNQERIECSMTITISERVSVEDFKANIQIQSRRPVYRSSYNCPMFNHQDNDFLFRYLQDQVLEFDEANINSNLTAVIGYYVYILLGLDYDSYSQEGGTPYFMRAQTIVNNAQAMPERGWKAFENQRNRYWLVENLLHTQFKGLRTCLYKYHRQGFDLMSDNVTDGRANVLTALKELKKVYDFRPNSFALQVFFNAKADEIVSLFSQASGDEKTQLMQLLPQVDPANSLKYNAITSGK